MCVYLELNIEVQDLRSDTNITTTTTTTTTCERHKWQFNLTIIFMRPSSLGGGRILRRTLSVRLSVCLSVCPSVRLSVRPSRYH